MENISPMSLDWALNDRRVVVVTGASQGIGRAIAVRFGSEGDAVVLAARNREGLEETAADVDEAGGVAIVVETDVTSESSVGQMVDLVMQDHGRIDVVVNNSGVGGPSGKLWELAGEEWRATFDVNVFGVFNVVHAILPVMIAQKTGTVIIVGSITGKRPLYGRSSYATSKAALIGLTRTLALETGSEGVRVNLVSPGFVAGPRLDWVIRAQAASRGISEQDVRKEFEEESALLRLTEPIDVADTVVYLASEEAGAITGADINVNSGVVMY
jgi:NAD(P)-dependent dehydrogenase (short-subunit alcohol dehydrogenase family)